MDCGRYLKYWMLRDFRNLAPGLIQYVQYILPGAINFRTVKFCKHQFGTHVYILEKTSGCCDFQGHCVLTNHEKPDTARPNLKRSILFKG
jgi:hypothetical protein